MKRLTAQKDSAWPAPEAGLSPLEGMAGQRRMGLPFAVMDGNSPELSGLIDLSATRSIFAFSR